MAESPLTKLNDEFLTCTICMGIYRDPKILSCLHSFCKKCIERHLEGSNNENVITCPHCHEITLLHEDGIQRLKNNYFIQNLIIFNESTSARFGERNCSYCVLLQKKNPAHGKCLTCGDFLCLECFGRHTFTTETFNHETATLQDLHSGKYNEKLRSSQKIPCQKHKKEFLRYFCDTCDVPVCRDCVILNHRQDHSIVQPCVAMNIKRQELGKLMEGLDNKMTEIKANVDILKEEEFKLMETQKHISDTMQETINIIVKKLQSEKRGKQKLLKAYMDSKREELAKRKKEQESKIQLLGKSMEFCRRVIDNGMEGEIVFLQDVMRERLSYLDACVHDIEIYKPLSPPSLAISEIVEETSPLSIFKIEFSTKKSAICQPDDKSKNRSEDEGKEGACFFPKSLEKSRSHIQNTDTHIGNSSDFVSVTNNGRNTANKHLHLTSGDVSNTPVLRLECFIDCKLIGDAHKPKLSSVSWLNEQTFVVADESNEKLKQYCITGKNKHSIVMRNLLTVAYANEIIYCGLKSYQIKLLNTKFENIHVISHSGNCVPVAVGRENPRVLCVGQTSIHTLNQKGTDILKSRPIVSKKQDRIVRLQPMHPHRFREDELVVSDWYSLAVFVIKSDGSILNTYIRKDNVNWKPGGLCCDNDDNIYIADYLKRELVVLNSRCEYVTTITLKNIHCPRGLDCSSTNKLLLTSKDGVSLFQISNNG
ncbi:hypothetical protein FSP39_024986 [Pinctada imbricata]|uniref:Uncharacterized protein n=1 Tax=Pinctada imbricata TaxID=66713 RepID=A0AA88YST8_PINIB|nr:hypothetical protein FSP39_024986 [Pinctada imbricata]